MIKGFCKSIFKAHRISMWPLLCIIGFCVSILTIPTHAAVIEAIKPTSNANRVTLSFADPGTYTSFEIRQRLNSGPETIVSTNISHSTSTLNISDLIDGEYTFTVYVYSDETVISSANSSTVTIDTTAPTATRIYAVVLLPATLKTGLIRWFDIPDDATTLSLERAYNNTTPNIVSENILPSSFGVTDNYLLEGSYTYYLYTYDRFNNKSLASTQNIIIDFTAPITPNLSIIKPLINGSLVGIHWEIPTDAISLSFKLNTPTKNILASINMTASGITMPTLNLSDGTYTAFLSVGDEMNNFSPSASVTFTIDTTAPTSFMLYINKNTSPNNEIHVVWYGAPTEDIDHFVLTKKLNGGIETTVSSNLTAPTGNTNYLLPDGNYQFGLYAIDEFQNTSNVTTWDVTIDTMPPTIPTISVTSSLYSNGSVSLSWIVPTSTYSLALFQSKNGEAYSTVNSNIATKTTSYNISNLSNGNYKYALYAKDFLNNTSSPSYTALIFINTIPPKQPTVSIEKLALNSPTINISWTIPTNTYSITYTQIKNNTALTRIYGMLPSQNSFENVNLSDGSYIFEVNAVDRYSNKSSTGSASIIIDTTPPSPPRILPVTFLPMSRYEGIILWSSVPTAAIGMSLTRTKTGTGSITISANIPIGPGGITPASVSVNYDGDGTYLYELKAFDEYGNYSIASTTNVIIDSISPEPPFFSASPITTKSSTLNVAWDVPTSTAQLRLKIISSTGNLIFLTNLSSETTSYNIKLENGSYTIELSASDEFSNISPTVSHTVSINAKLSKPSLYIVTYLPMSDMTGLIRWIAPEGTAYLRLENSINGGPLTIVSANIAPSSTHITRNYEVTGNYLYYITAIDAIGEESETATFNIEIDITPPKNPTLNINYSFLNPSSVSLNWEIAPDTEFSALYRSFNNGFWVTINYNISNLTSTFSESLETDGYYVYKLISYDRYLNASYTTKDITIDTIAPDAPMITANITTLYSPTVNIKWSIPTGTVEFNYRIFKNNEIFDGLDRILPDYSPLRHLVLHPGQYRIEMIAIDTYQNKSITGSCTITVNSIETLQPILYIQKIPRTKNIIVEWALPREDGTGKLVRWKNNEDMEIVSENIAPDSYRLIINDLDEATYIYGLTFTNRLGYTTKMSTWNLEIDITPPHTTTLQIKKQKRKYNNIDLFWNIPESTTGFILKRSFNNGDISTLNAYIPTPTRHYKDMNLEPGEYTYYLYSYDKFFNLNSAVTKNISINSTSSFEQFLETSTHESGILNTEFLITTPIEDVMIGTTNKQATFNIIQNYQSKNSQIGNGIYGNGTVIMNNSEAKWNEQGILKLGNDQGKGEIQLLEGQITIKDTLFIGDSNASSGTLKLFGGTLKTKKMIIGDHDTGNLEWEGGSLQVEKVSGSLNNTNGELIINSKTGTTISGNYTQGENASIKIILNNYPNPEQALLNVSQTIELLGKIKIEIGDYSPKMGDLIKIISEENLFSMRKIALTSTPSFSLELPEIDSRLSWDTSKFETEGLLTIKGSGDDLLPGRPLNYPNPFTLSSGTSIGFWLDQDSDTELRIYTASGQEVFREQYKAGIDPGAKAGYNKILINSSIVRSELPSGVYPYILIHAGKTIGKGKMVIRPEPRFR